MNIWGWRVGFEIGIFGLYVYIYSCPPDKPDILNIYQTHSITTSTSIWIHRLCKGNDSNKCHILYKYCNSSSIIVLYILVEVVHIYLLSNNCCHILITCSMTVKQKVMLLSIMISEWEWNVNRGCGGSNWISPSRTSMF